MSRSFGSFGRYIQRRGEIARLGDYLASMGKRPFILIDAFLYDRYVAGLGERLKDDFIARFEKFGGECCDDEMARVTQLCEQHGADVVVGFGGGKTLDTAKMAAHRTKARMVVVPSIASTDAPTSAVVVAYTKEGAIQFSHHLPANPDLVLVDPEIIVAAPVRFLVAGMGDALATWYEARANIESGSFNYISGDFPTSRVGHPATRAGAAIARECYHVIMEKAVQAKRAAETGVITQAVEDIIEANILLSGLGFENCGVSAAHGVHDGLTILPDVHGFFHGEKVAFGILCLLVLENRPHDEIKEVLHLFCQVGLPTSLADLNIKENVEEKIRKVAEAAMKAPITQATPAMVGVDEIEAAILTANALGRAFMS